MKNITVIGATGMIGIPVTKELIKSDFNVTALVRDTENAKKIFSNKLNIVKGELANKSSIADAIRNADGIYINISTRPQDKENAFSPEIQGLDNILEVAKKMPNVKQIVLLSSFLARNYQGNWWVMKAKQSGINRVKNSGIPYTIFYPSNFMENIDHGMIRNGKITILTTSDAKNAWWIAGEDFAKNVANAFNTQKALNNEYAVQGLECMSMHTVSKKFASFYAKEKLSVISIPFGIVKVFGIFVPQMKFLSNLMNVMLKNEENFEAKKTWEELGKPQITIEQYAKNISI